MSKMFGSYYILERMLVRLNLEAALLMLYAVHIVYVNCVSFVSTVQIRCVCVCARMRACVVHVRYHEILDCVFFISDLCVVRVVSFLCLLFAVPG